MGNLRRLLHTLRSPQSPEVGTPEWLEAAAAQLGLPTPTPPYQIQVADSPQTGDSPDLGMPAASPSILPQPRSAGAVHRLASSLACELAETTALSSAMAVWAAATRLERHLQIGTRWFALAMLTRAMERWRRCERHERVLGAATREAPWVAAGRAITVWLSYAAEQQFVRFLDGIAGTRTVTRRLRLWRRRAAERRQQEARRRCLIVIGGPRGLFRADLPFGDAADACAFRQTVARALSTWRQFELCAHVEALDGHRVRQAAARRALYAWQRAVHTRHATVARALGRTYATLARTLRVWRARIAAERDVTLRAASGSRGVQTLARALRTWRIRLASARPLRLPLRALAGSGRLPRQRALRMWRGWTAAVRPLRALAGSGWLPRRRALRMWRGWTADVRPLRARTSRVRSSLLARALCAWRARQAIDGLLRVLADERGSRGSRVGRMPLAIMWRRWRRRAAHAAACAARAARAERAWASARRHAEQVRTLQGGPLMASDGL